MELLEELLNESCVKKLGIDKNAGLNTLRRLCDLQRGKAFIAYVERKGGKRIKVILRSTKDYKDIWRALRASKYFIGKGICWKRLEKNYSLTHLGKVIEPGILLGSINISGGSVIKFQRKKFQEEN
ncbi:hypothetical protein SteCoe_36057 [Stentor coeruleus]|uniref:Uncharacterized protein n=1 Tax=Stentor coeruleus TaxID=5963 RepID=A0A1R2AR72_9CILI|nr:hypothetical protein SteCoe_36057 [Stentor coeruleus]